MAWQGCEVELQNAGISGYTAGQILDEQVPQIEEFKPTLITFQSGGNDLANGVSADDYRSNVQAVLDAATGSGARVVVLAQNEWFRAPGFEGYSTPEAREEFDSILIEEAQSRGAQFVDMRPIYKQQADENLWVEDGMHPTPEAYETWATELASQVPAPASDVAGALEECSSRRDGEQAPFAGHALELMGAAVLEFESGTDHQVAQRAGHEDVVRSGQCADAGADMHGDTADVVASDLALSGVQSGADLDTEGSHRVANCHGAADRSLRSVERREEAVA